VLQNDTGTIRSALESDNGTYYNWNQSARRIHGKSLNGGRRLPLFVAAAQDMRWTSSGGSGGGGWLKQILMANRAAIEDTDLVTGLNPFMLAAAGMGSDFEAVYRLLVEHPIALVSASGGGSCSS